MGEVLAFARVRPNKRLMIVAVYPDEDPRYYYLKVIDPDKGHTRPARYSCGDVMRTIFECAMYAERKGFDFEVHDHTGEIKVVEHA